MKYILTLLSILAVALTLTSCNGSDKGAEAARQLNAAWGNPDAIKQIAANYAASRDSLFIPGEASMMNNAFIDACAGNDSLQVLAQAIALDVTELGKANGTYIVDGLKSGSLDGKTAASRLGMIDMALSMLGRSNDITACFAAIDEVAQSLSEEQQMQVYARSCSPSALGDAMKAERASNSADTDRRAKIVEGILTGEDLETFKTHYYSK